MIVKPTMTLTERKQVIQNVQTLLRRLLKDVCPACAKDEQLFCEVHDGRHHHVSGICTASRIRELMSHVDDVRDQFANEFNEEQKARAHWTFQVLR